MDRAPVKAENNGTLDGQVVAVLVADGVEEVEVRAPREALGSAGAEVGLLSPDGAAVQGYHYLTPEDELEVDGAIGRARPAEIDALVLPGGLGGPDTLRTDAAAVDLVRACVDAGTPIGVICHGPWLLIEAGALAGRSLTCVPALQTDVTNAGAGYVEAAVHIDDGQRPILVSGRNFEAAEEFAGVLVRELTRVRERSGVG